MHNIVDILELFKQHNVRIMGYGGWYLDTQKNNDPFDRWTILHDVVYRNLDPVTKAQIMAYAKSKDNYVPVQVMIEENRKRAKKITPKKGYDHECDCD